MQRRAVPDIYSLLFRDHIGRFFLTSHHRKTIREVLIPLQRTRLWLLH